MWVLLRTLVALAVAAVAAYIWLWLSVAAIGYTLSTLEWLIFGANSRAHDVLLAIGNPFAILVAGGTTMVVFMCIFQTLRGAPD
jgi:hypothetical protein